MRRLAALGFVLLSAVVSGCYTHTPIKPTELPKLNGSGVVGLGQSGNTSVYAVSVAHVEAPDGHLEEISGRFDAVVTDGHRGTVSFDHPVESSVTGNTLTVRGGNRGQTQFDLGDVRDVTIKQRNPAEVIWWGLGGAALGGLIGIAMIAAIGGP